MKLARVSKWSEEPQACVQVVQIRFISVVISTQFSEASTVTSADHLRMLTSGFSVPQA